MAEEEGVSTGEGSGDSSRDRRDLGVRSGDRGDGILQSCPIRCWWRSVTRKGVADDGSGKGKADRRGFGENPLEDGGWQHDLDEGRSGGGGGRAMVGWFGGDGGWWRWCHSRAAVNGGGLGSSGGGAGGRAASIFFWIRKMTWPVDIWVFRGGEEEKNRCGLQGRRRWRGANGGRRERRRGRRGPCGNRVAGGDGDGALEDIGVALGAVSSGGGRPKLDGLEIAPEPLREGRLLGPVRSRHNWVRHRWEGMEAEDMEDVEDELLQDGDGEGGVH